MIVAFVTGDPLLHTSVIALSTCSAVDERSSARLMLRSLKVDRLDSTGGKMKISRTGIILNTERYKECVSFYRDLFGLKVIFEDNELTCFDFFGSYLMVETGGFTKSIGKDVSECPSKLRFNVPDIDEALKQIQNYGIEAKIERNPWGSTINIFDPDGNRIGVRDEATFRSQPQA